MVFFKKPHKPNKYNLGDKLYCYHKRFGIVSFHVRTIYTNTTTTNSSESYNIVYEGGHDGNYYGKFNQGEVGLDEIELTSKLLKRGFRLEDVKMTTRTQEEYKIVTGSTTQQLSTKVNNLIQDGWEVSGDITLNDVRRVYYLQLIKYSKETTIINQAGNEVIGGYNPPTSEQRPKPSARPPVGSLNNRSNKLQKFWQFSDALLDEVGTTGGLISRLSTLSECKKALREYYLDVDSKF